MPNLSVKLLFSIEICSESFGHKVKKGRIANNP